MPVENAPRPARAAVARRWLWPLSVALVVRATRGYRGFPSIDDYAYVPVARAALDPTLYVGDWTLGAFMFHSPVWALVVGAADRTIGLANGLWVATILLTIATVFAADRLLRTAGLPAYVLPLFVAVGFLGRVQGIGRAAYDGALGEGFHAQWVAICLLLWCYHAFAKGRPLTTGVLLGLATLAHPLVGLHGAFALAIATLAVRGAAWRELAITATLCAIVSTPLTVPLVLQFRQHTPTWRPMADVVRDGLLFRAPHHYILTDLRTPTLLLLGLLAVCGIAAAVVVHVRRPVARGRLIGVCAGHVVLLVASLLLYGPLRATALARSSFLPYSLDLTRTTSLVVVISTLLLMTAAWSFPRRAPTAGARALWLGFVAALVTLVLVGVSWQLPLIILVAVSTSVGLLRIPVGVSAMTSMLAVLSVVAGASIALRDRQNA
ncbi:MAG: hypothetical protein ABIW79_09910, partial [Gemmatimonas sp.]